MLIRVPPLFNYEECQWFLHRNYDECLYQIRADKIGRALIIEGQPILINITLMGEHLAVSILDPLQPTKAQRASVRDYVIKWFDLKRDLVPFQQMLRSQPKLAFLWSSYGGLRLMGIPDMFEAICWCIIGQQINLPFAYKLKRRLVEAYGTAIIKNGERYWSFPSPADVALASTDQLRDMQFSRQKIAYLIEIAKQFELGNISLDACRSLPNQTSRLKFLQSFKGIGPWTANYVLMKCLGDSAAIPWGDAGLLAALENLDLIQHRKDLKSMQDLFSNFTGFESYLVLYLWRNLAPKN